MMTDEARYIQDTRILTRYRAGLLSRACPITEIVVHNTGGGASAEGVIVWQAYTCSQAEASNFNRAVGLFHYLIDFAGAIHSLIPEKEFWCYHSSSGQNDRNTVGVELLNKSSTNNMPNTEHQYKALALLCRDLLRKHPTIERIVGHRHNSMKFSGIDKECPGSGFDWQQFILALDLQDIGVKVIDKNALQVRTG